MRSKCGSARCTMRSGRAAPRWSAGATIVLQFAFGCTSRPEPEIPAPEREPELPLLRPHWDQVCGERRTPLVLDGPGEVVDTTALADELTDLASAPAWEDADPFVEVAVSYDRSGAIRRTYVQQQNVGREQAQTVLDRLTERLSPQDRLLEPIDLRVRTNLALRAQLELLPAIECMPHVSHERGQPPRFLGGARVVPGRICGTWRDPERCIAARLHISPRGQVEEIEPLNGNASLVEAVRESVAETKFDPALVNREPVPGTLELVFRFPQ